MRRLLRALMPRVLRERGYDAGSRARSRVRVERGERPKRACLLPQERLAGISQLSCFHPHSFT